MSIELQDEVLETSDEDEEMASGEHGEIGGNLLTYVNNYVIAQDLGFVFNAQTSFVIPGVGGTKQPDVAFVKKERLPEPAYGNVPFAPDLAVEVVSPTDTLYGVFEKAELYQAAGIGLVWVVVPHGRLVWEYRPGLERLELRLEATLNGYEVLPGFSLMVAELFARDGATKSAVLRRLLSSSQQ